MFEGCRSSSHRDSCRPCRQVSTVSPLFCHSSKLIGPRPANRRLYTQPGQCDRSIDPNSNRFVHSAFGLSPSGPRWGSLSPEWRPSRIGRIGGRFHRTFVEPGDVDRYEPRGKSAATRIQRSGFAPEHQHPAIRGEGWPFNQPALGQNALPRTIRVHYADSETGSLASIPSEGDEVSPW